MKVLLGLKNLSLTYDAQKIFSDLDFILYEGETLGLLGPNGEGKSSLLKVILGEVSPDQESLHLFDYAKSEDFDLKRDIAYVSQDFPLIDGNHKVEDFVFLFDPSLAPLFDAYETISTSGDFMSSKAHQIQQDMEHFNYWKRQELFLSYLGGFGDFDPLKPLSALSGGEQKKVLISYALSHPGKLIFWDEPTNHLDLESIMVLEDEIKSSQKTQILISHDRFLLSKVCDRMAYLSRGNLKTYKGSYEEYLEAQVLEDQTRKKTLDRLKNKLRREQEWMRQGIKARGTRAKGRVDQFHHLKNTIENERSKLKQKLSLFELSDDKKGKKLIEFKNFSLSRGENLLIQDFDHTIYRKNKIGLLGSNGSGKTSLVKSLLEELKFQGEIFKRDDLKIVTYRQHLTQKELAMTPYEYIGEGSESIQTLSGRTMHINGYFESFLFEAKDLHRPMHKFSGGQKSRIRLAKTLTDQGDLYIFDEPTNDLDIETIEILEKTLNLSDVSLLLISHDRSFLENVVDQVWCLENKSIQVFYESVSDALSYMELQTPQNTNKASNGHILEKNSIHSEQQKTQSVSEEKHRKKLTNFEKERLKKLPKLIEEFELKVSNKTKEIESLLNDLQHADVAIQVSNLQIELESLESELLELYEEQDDLSS